LTGKNIVLALRDLLSRSYIQSPLAIIQGFLANRIS